MDDFPEKPKRGETSQSLDTSQNRMVGAFVLIGLGVVFLLTQNDVISSDFNWWSFFIIIPGLAILFNAYTDYSKAGYLTNTTRGKIMSGTMMIIVGAIFLFDLDWGRVWPVFMIVPGLFMLLGANQQSDN